MGPPTLWKYPFKLLVTNTCQVKNHKFASKSFTVCTAYVTLSLWITTNKTRGEIFKKSSKGGIPLPGHAINQGKCGQMLVRPRPHDFLSITETWRSRKEVRLNSLEENDPALQINVHTLVESITENRYDSVFFCSITLCG